MLEQRRSCRQPLLAATLVLALGACASPGKYDLSVQPNSPPERFENIEVAPVTTGITSHSLDISAPAMLRSAVVDALAKTGRYSSVEPEIEAAPGVLRVNCEISEYETGSQAMRWLVGRFAGGAYLDATCSFEDAETNRLYAQGVFTGEVKSGWFGGSAGIEGMADDAAAALARFLEKGND